MGFIVNRLQLALWREAFSIAQRGIASPQDVDRAVKDRFGRRLGMVGPFELNESIDGYDLTLQCEKYILPDMDTSNTSYPISSDTRAMEARAKEPQGENYEHFNQRAESLNNSFGIRHRICRGPGLSGHGRQGAHLRY